MTAPISSFYFAWADENQTSFDPATMAVIDEVIVSFLLKHDEGQIPTLDIVVKNPRIGLLNPGRKVWAWFSYLPNAAELAQINSMYGTGWTYPWLAPLFFGVLVGVPTDLFQEKISLKFIARSSSYIEDKQAVAETMKISPFYD